MVESARSKPHLSFSQLNCYLKCPRFYRFKYVEELPMRPLYVMASGSAVHKGMEENNKALVLTGSGLSAKDMLELSVTMLEYTPGVEEMDVKLPKAKDQLVREAGPTLCEYKNSFETKVLGDSAPDGHIPLSTEDVERELQFEFAGEFFVGYVDVILPCGIIDYKFSSRRKSQHMVDRDMQLWLYRRQLNLPGSFVQLLRGKESVHLAPQHAPEHVGRGVINCAESVVRAIKISKETGSFPQCDPTSWWCDQDCPFYRKCFP